MIKNKIDLFIIILSVLMIIPYAILIWFFINTGLAYQEKIPHGTHIVFELSNWHQFTKTWKAILFVVIILPSLPSLLLLVIFKILKHETTFWDIFFLVLIFIPFGTLFWLSYFSIKYIVSKKIEKTSHFFSFENNKKLFKKIGILFILSLTILLPLSLFIFIKKTNNKYYPPGNYSINTQINLSNKSSQINTIEIFTDGFDPEFFLNSNYENQINIKKLKGFNYSDKVITSAFHTLNSESQILYGDKTYNDIYKKIYNNDFLKNTFKSAEWEQTKTIYSPNLSNNIERNYIGNIDNNPLIAHSLNSRNAQKILKTKYNISGFSPSAAPYELFIRDIKPSNKPSYNILSDNITHIPTFTTRSGHLNVFGTSTMESNIYLLNFINRLTSKLRKIKLSDNNNLTLFDNTNIYIWGDHASHINRDAYPFSNETSRKNRTMFFFHEANVTKMIKTPYPQLKKYDQLEIWAPFLRRIINAKVLFNESFENFIKKNIVNFQKDRKFLTWSKVSDAWWVNKIASNKNYEMGVNGYSSWYKDINDIPKDILKEILWKQ